jgi:hypothetical protein
VFLFGRILVVMSLNNKTFTTVTTFSKLVALTLFVALPFIGFCVGRRYQEAIDKTIYHEQKIIELKKQGEILEKKLRQDTTPSNSLMDK